ncbi:uncharacterized protein FIBRA_02645 [Fibroporia radiculosa]|uniref:Uncharacterized protein n=1 Tax=Fibroporia radiculosa TaxID=599839 RepID=J4H1Z0_9APHY|nr:uncharacterized protein FIBRA_02645 [Fibroporia radiculosa]CCM00609.1 predicted protein [Fibroporia radiculosa]
MSADSGVHLTTSRISRVFRPLRAKCITLAEFFPIAPVRRHTLVSVTYANKTRPASRSTPIEHDTPPLAVLQPPETLGSRIHLDRTSVENLQLSRKIYEVRDAFRNLVQVALGPGNGHKPNSTRIMSLAAMCSVVVGEHIQSELRACEEDELVEDENASAKLMDELYEAVPPHYRR